VRFSHSWLFLPSPLGVSISPCVYARVCGCVCICVCVCVCVGGWSRASERTNAKVKKPVLVSAGETSLMFSKPLSCEVVVRRCGTRRAFRDDDPHPPTSRKFPSLCNRRLLPFAAPKKTVITVVGKRPRVDAQTRRSATDRWTTLVSLRSTRSPPTHHCHLPHHSNQCHFKKEHTNQRKTLW
jgi:hypothetical protein